MILRHLARTYQPSRPMSRDADQAFIVVAPPGEQRV